MSREHIWPDWMEELFPRTSADSHNQEKLRLRLHKGGHQTAQRTVKTRSGHASTVKVRKVCETCNNGWMSEMENRTKGLLLRLARSEPSKLDIFLQHRLATWAAKTAMTAEFSDPSSVAVSQEHRRLMMDKLEPPLGWWIWMARCSGNRWQTAYHHHSFALGVSKGPPINPLVSKVANTQSSTIGVGQLLFHAVSTSTEIRFDGGSESLMGLRCIWPITDAVVDWPFSMILSDEEAEIVADTLNRTLRTMRNVAWVPID